MNMPFWLLMLGVVGAMGIVVSKVWLLAFNRYEDWRVRRNRETLRGVGLTPEQYMATLSPLDYQDYAEGVTQFWARRQWPERRNAILNRIGKALGPTAARDIRELKSLADRRDRY